MVFHRHAAQMHDAVDALAEAQHGLQVGNVGGHELFALCRLAQVPDVGEAKLGIDAFQRLAQAAADVARRTGDEHAFHVAPFPFRQTPVRASIE